MNWKLMKTMFGAALLIAALAAGQQADRADLLMEAAARKERVDGDLKAAIEQYGKIAAQFAKQPEVAAKALLQMGQCQEKLGQAEARKSYERVVKEYGGAAQYASAARARLAAMNGLTETLPAAFAAVRLMGDGAYPTGRVSPDGRWLPWLDPEHGDLRLRDMKTGEIRPLTNDRSGWANSAGFSVVSPNSTRVAFAWSNASIQLVNLDGTGRRTLVPALGSGISMGPLAWMPDAKSIVAGSVSMRGSQVKFGIVTVASGQVDWHEPVALALNQNSGGASLSADGRYLLVPGASPTAPQNQNIFVYDLTRRQLSLLVDHPASDISPAWSGDGKTVYFVSDRRGLNDIYALPFKDGVAAGDPRLLHSVAGRLTLFGVSANGSLIALEQSGSTELYSLPLIHTTGTEAGKPARIQTRVAGGDSYPVWSPDGQSLAFLRARGNAPALIVLRDAATKAEREIAPGFPALNISWHPDGRRILMTGTAKDGLAMLDTMSGQTSKIAIPPGEMPPLARIGYSVYSPEGTEIYYGARSGSEYSLVALNPSTGQSRKVNGPSKSIMYRVNCFSPDGKWFLFYEGTLDDTNQKSLMIRPAAGGEARELIRGKNIWLGQAAFTPDSKDVIVGGTFTHLGDVKPGFWRISADGGSPRKIHQLDRPVSFSVHPSGREIVYSDTTAVRSLWTFPTASPTVK